MVLNAGKRHFMNLGSNTENETFLFYSILIENSKEQKIIGVIIDNKLNFQSHISELCKKPSQKISALCLVIYINLRKKINFQLVNYVLLENIEQHH